MGHEGLRQTLVLIALNDAVRVYNKSAAGFDDGIFIVDTVHLPNLSSCIGKHRERNTPIDHVLELVIIHILYTNIESMDIDRIFIPSFWNSGYLSATAEISVAQTNVKFSHTFLNGF